MTGPRIFAERTTAQIGAELTENAILCLPVGSLEQHGPHLPLATDTIIAEHFAAALADHLADRHEIWQLPAVPFGLSLEHAWAPGTVSLRINTFTTLIQQLVTEYLRATPARALVIINGHGGNRGILEPLLYEIAAENDLAACVLHPASLTSVKPGGELPDVHAGIGETSLMLHIAPELVNHAALGAADHDRPQRIEAINRVVRDRGVTWPWTSGAPDIADEGVIGDPAGADAELGLAILNSALEKATAAIDRLAAGSAPDLIRRA